MEDKTSGVSKQMENFISIVDDSLTYVLKSFLLDLIVQTSEMKRIEY